MCPAASYDERRMVLLARLRVAPDCGFPAHPALRGSAAVLSAANHPQDGFPAAPHEDDPAQTVSLRGIPLFAWHRRDGLAPVALAWPFLRFAGHRHVWPAPAARVSVCSAAVSHLAGYAVRLFVLAAIPAHGAAGRTAPAAHPQKNPLILCGLAVGLHGAVAEQFRRRFRGQSFLPARSPCVPRCPSCQAASRCHSVLLRISVPSGAARWTQLDVLAACLSGGRFALEYQEL